MKRAASAVLIGPKGTAAQLEAAVLGRQCAAAGAFREGGRVAAEVAALLRGGAVAVRRRRGGIYIIYIIYIIDVVSK